MQFLKSIFGSKNDRELKRMGRIVKRVNAIEEEVSAYSEEEIKGAKDGFRKRLDDGETLDDILVEAFALTREASKRTIGLRHFDVQMIGGITLHASTRISTLISIRGSANFSGVVQLLQTEVLCQTEGPNF